VFPDAFSLVSSVSVLEFLSYDRYVTHMNVHKQYDYYRFYKDYCSKQQKNDKIFQEKQLLFNINEMRSYLGSSVDVPPASLPSEFRENDDGIPSLLQQEGGLSSPSMRFPTSLRSIEFTAAKPLPSLDFPHRYNLYRTINSVVYMLELVSKHSMIVAKSEILLDSQVTRIGSHESCECHISFSVPGGSCPAPASSNSHLESVNSSGSVQGMIAKVHCLLYHSTVDSRSSEDDAIVSSSTISSSQVDSKNHITIVDNSSQFGTYVVTKDGALKVPSKISKGLVVQNGSLICVGVTINGPPVLPVSEANSACLVYRLQILNS
jgi:hypothetical protein